MREGWTVQIFESVEAAEIADREENLRRTGVERIRLLTAISTPDDARREPRPRTFQILDYPNQNEN